MRKIIVLVLGPILVIITSTGAMCEWGNEEDSKEEPHDQELLNFLEIDPQEIDGTECLDISPPSAPEITLRDIAEDQYTTHKLIRESEKWLTYVDTTLILEEVEDVFWESIKLPANLLVGAAINEYGIEALKVLWQIKTAPNPPGFGLGRQIGELLYATGEYIKNKSFLNGQFHIYFCLLRIEQGVDYDSKSFTISVPFDERIHEDLWSTYDIGGLGKGYLPSVIGGCGLRFPEAEPTDPEMITPEYVKFLTAEAWKLAHANYLLEIDKENLKKQILACEKEGQIVAPTPVFTPTLSPTPSPTLIPPTPSPIITCPPEGEPKFTLGQGVYTTDKLKVREKPGLTSLIIRTVDKEASGVILEGPVNKDGYTWWMVRYFDVTGWSVGEWFKPRLVIQPIDCLSEMSLREFLNQVKEALAKKDIYFFIENTRFEEIPCQEYREQAWGGWQRIKEPAECIGKDDQTFVPSIFLGIIRSEGYPITKEEFRDGLREALDQPEPSQLYGVIYPAPWDKDPKEAHLVITHPDSETKIRIFQILELIKDTRGNWQINGILLGGREEFNGFLDPESNLVLLYPGPSEHIFYRVEELAPLEPTGDIQRAIENAIRQVLRDEQGNPLISQDEFKQHLLVNKSGEYQIIYQKKGDIFLISILGSPFEEWRQKAEKEFLEIIQVDKKVACQLDVRITTPLFANPAESGKIFYLSFCEL